MPKGANVRFLMVILVALISTAASAQREVESSSDGARFGRVAGTPMKFIRYTNGITVIEFDTVHKPYLITASARDLYWLFDGNLISHGELTGNATVDIGGHLISGAQATFRADERSFYWTGPVQIQRSRQKQVWDAGCSGGNLTLNGQNYGQRSRHNPVVYEGTMFWCNGNQLGARLIEDDPL